MTLTYKQTIEEHQRMWRWLAEQTRKKQAAVSKFEYIHEQEKTDPEFTKKIGNNFCFLCKYAEQLRTDKSVSICDYCIGCWDDDTNWNANVTCETNPDEPDSAGLYQKWMDAWSNNDWKQTAAYADQMAELPIHPIQKAVHIKWDTDGDEKIKEKLPKEISIPRDITDEDAISDYLSDLTGFCHNGFLLETCK